MLLTFYQPDPESGFPDEETSEIYVMNSDGTDMKNLSNRSGLDGFAEWSPDGKLIAFQSTRGNGTDNIFVMDGRRRQYPPTHRRPCERHATPLVARRQVDILHQPKQASDS